MSAPSPPPGGTDAARTVSAPAPGDQSADPVAGEVALHCRSVCVSFGGLTVLDHAELTARRGHVHALIGPNGAGKTTLANVITGHVRAAAGEVMLNGQPLRGAPWQRARRGVGRKFQVPRVFPRLTGRQNLELAGPGAQLDAGGEHLAGIADVSGHALSHGLRQWLELQMVLAQRPRLIVLDEPTAGLSRGDRRMLAEAILGRRDRVATFLVVEHDLDFIEKIADRVSFMAAGRVEVSGTFDDVRKARQVRETYLGSYA
jgi:urea transport system ATP-binding protein